MMASPETAANLSKQEIDYSEHNTRLTKEVAQLFPPQGEWTEEDYLRLPDTNRFIELSEGKLVIPEMPTYPYQCAVRELFIAIRMFVYDSELGEVCFAPLRVRLWPGKFREPDIVFMSAAHTDRIGEDFWGVPDMVVEVLSPSTILTDRRDKFFEYAQAGISEYWMVDLEECTIEIYVLKQGAYKLLGKWGAGEVACSEVLAGFEVMVDAVVGG